MHHIYVHTPVKRDSLCAQSFLLYKYVHCDISTEFVVIEPVVSSDSTTLTAISASLGAFCVLALLIGILVGCLTARMCLRSRGTAHIADQQLEDLNLAPVSVTAPPVSMYEDMAPAPRAKPSVPMYEDIDDTRATTFSNTIMMEENEAYGRKITM